MHAAHDLRAALAAFPFAAQFTADLSGEHGPSAP
jgi:hypothetical protein